MTDRCRDMPWRVSTTDQKWYNCILGTNDYPRPHIVTYRLFYWSLPKIIGIVGDNGPIAGIFVC